MSRTVLERLRAIIRDPHSEHASWVHPFDDPRYTLPVISDAVRNDDELRRDLIAEYLVLAGADDLVPGHADDPGKWRYVGCPLCGNVVAWPADRPLTEEDGRRLYCVHSASSPPGYYHPDAATGMAPFEPVRVTLADRFTEG